MDCPIAPEVKARLLSPAFKPILQKYTDLARADPSFLQYHQASTLLALRQELHLTFDLTRRCAECDHDTLMNCQLIDVLAEAIKERLAEEATENK